MRFALCGFGSSSLVLGSAMYAGLGGTLSLVQAIAGAIALAVGIAMFVRQRAVS